MPNDNHPSEWRFRACFLVLVLLLLIPLVIRSNSTNCSSVPEFVPSLAGSGYVAINGDVAYPGLYPISAKCMASSVILLAVPGGAVSAQDWKLLNETILVSGDEFLLRRVGEQCVLRKGRMPVAQRLTMNIKLPLAEITEAELEYVPGIGRIMAGRIVKYRQKNGGKLSLDDLLNIEGIGEKKFKLLKKYFN